MLENGLPEVTDEEAMEDLLRRGPESAAPNRTGLEKAYQVVQQQAEDEGLWFDAQTAPEAYLQKALRELHAAIEGSYCESCGLCIDCGASLHLRVSYGAGDGRGQKFRCPACYMIHERS